ncbi:hypothetical protein M8J77_012079 [Diaphorina citri]|nr:hypothetical protein M8J77_012079 [Diaphorina citri]
MAEVGTNVAAFLGKLWRMVEDPETNDLISWSENGQSFLIRNQSKFAKELLPRYYKHNNMASFIRQLNMYGFHKIVSPDAGGLKTTTNDEVEFSHTYFIRGHAYMLEHIKRKTEKPVFVYYDSKAFGIIVRRFPKKTKKTRCFYLN